MKSLPFFSLAVFGYSGTDFSQVLVTLNIRRTGMALLNISYVYKSIGYQKETGEQGINVRWSTRLAQFWITLSTCTQTRALGSDADLLAY